MPELHPLLAERWSPHAFDPTAVVTGAELASLLEAARWAPSADDSQPWRFVTGRRDDETYKRSSPTWPTATSVGPTGRRADRRRLRHRPDGGTPPATAAYDLGQAVAHLTVQAMTLRRYVRQMIHFDRAGLRADLELPAWVRLYVVVAVGRLGDPLTLPADLRRRELGLRRAGR